MGLVRVRVKITNAFDAMSALRGLLPAEQVQSYETEALIDTGAFCSILPPFVVDCLGIRILGRTEARMANGTLQETGVTEPFLVEILGRETEETALVLGDQILLGATVLEEMDLLVDCRGERVIPNPAHPDQPVFRV
jgi:clan AA aspartic protease